MSAKPASKRIYTVDLMRFLAIVLMVIFHFIYDLKFFGWVPSSIPDGEGWREFRYVILSLFFLCVGFSLAAVHGSGFRQKHFVKRLIQLLLASAAVTISSLIMAPNNWIFFGVLHFITVASLICVPLSRFPKSALLIGILIILAFNLNWVGSIWPFQPIRHLLPGYTNDYVGLFPWTGVVLIGIWLAYQDWFLRDPARTLARSKIVLFASKHSLIIYLVHQPILFAIFGLIGVIWKA
ncbi:heparan-alpha-glucosaminide N-acetyltransferase [Aliiglaciecola sp. 3_MG-2023]|uniref:heparan-alpha-glucosaminide N-acetyltransferase n=1 Tax=Aliiglaciecola sp. 3_MG-2023 TaxID=3062644 RepID=UPI0026E2BB8C|nr:heparan-alpha-glucosaminide N-acetyltransferase [Aliiglaciecola sp. 3_MG-2023]MDO6692964.1 heparan-alpha-glucosaminide N-acetyltransferase [Aliiglaciecola sp. 3_MG-2023]